jgi:type II restriction enzyme
MRVEMAFEVAARYKSPSQRARVVTESWGEGNLYCVNCSSPGLVRSPANTEAVDFTCPECLSPFQLKSQASAFSRRIVDAGYDAMRRAIIEDRTPNLVTVHYDSTVWRVVEVLLIPRFAFSMSAIEKRSPLSPSARRAGWIGCNILLSNIPDDAKIHLVRAGVPSNPESVRQKYFTLKPLTLLDAELRGWTLDVLKVARSLGKEQFSLDELYAHDLELKSLHPTNRHVKAKIRQQVQRLRDLEIIDFLGSGTYRFRRMGVAALHM